MGTTVTPNLGLIKADDNESIKANLPTFPGWAVQQGQNADAIDALFRHDVNTYTPTFTVDATPQPTLGAGGFTEGKYIRLFPRMVMGWFRVSMGGAGFTTGTGLYRVSLPVAAAAEFATMEQIVSIGKAYLFDSSTVVTSTTLNCIYYNTSNLIEFHKSDGDFWRQNTPMTLAQGDVVSGFFQYPTSAP